MKYPAWKPVLNKTNKMTYYNTQLLKIREQYYLKPCIIHHLTKARRFIEENYCDDIDLQTIAEFSFFSKFHFIRLFKRCYGRTPHQYLTEKRISLAKKLLGSNLTVIETCYHIGFVSPASFSATFRKHTGISPSDYKKKQFSISPYEKSAPILPFIKHYQNED